MHAVRQRAGIDQVSPCLSCQGQQHGDQIQHVISAAVLLLGCLFLPLLPLGQALLASGVSGQRAEHPVQEFVSLSFLGKRPGDHIARQHGKHRDQDLFCIFHLVVTLTEHAGPVCFLSDILPAKPAPSLAPVRPLIVRPMRRPHPNSALPDYRTVAKHRRRHGCMSPAV